MEQAKSKIARVGGLERKLELANDASNWVVKAGAG